MTVGSALSTLTTRITASHAACCEIMAITLTLFPIKSQQLKPIYSVFHARLPLPTHTIHILHFYLLFNTTIQFSFWKEFFSSLLLSSSLLSCFMYSRPDSVNQPVKGTGLDNRPPLCLYTSGTLKPTMTHISQHNSPCLLMTWIEHSGQCLYINFLLLRDKYT